MSLLSSIWKKLIGESEDEKLPLVLMLAPTLLITSLTLVIYKFSPLLSLFGFATLAGILFVWKLQQKGMFATLSTLLLVLILNLTAKNDFSSLWLWTFFLSSLLTLTIYLLSFEEIKSILAVRAKWFENESENFHKTLKNRDQENQAEKKGLIEKCAELEQHLHKSKEEISSLNQLIEASQIESEKILYQHESLLEESLKNHRELTKMRLYYQENSKLVKELNYFRTDAFQRRLLQEKAEKELKAHHVEKLQELVTVAKNIKQEPAPKLHEESQELEKMEQEKSDIKEQYNTLTTEYHELKKKYELYSARRDKLTKEEQNSEKVKSYFDALDKELAAKKKALNLAKTQLVNLERELYVLKKEMQEKGIPIH